MSRFHNHHYVIKPWSVFPTRVSLNLRTGIILGGSLARTSLGEAWREEIATYWQRRYRMNDNSHGLTAACMEVFLATNGTDTFTQEVTRRNSVMGAARLMVRDGAL